MLQKPTLNMYACYIIRSLRRNLKSEQRRRVIFVMCQLRTPSLDLHSREMTRIIGEKPHIINKIDTENLELSLLSRRSCFESLMMKVDDHGNANDLR